MSINPQSLADDLEFEAFLKAGRRAEILSKEIWTLRDFQDFMGLSHDTCWRMRRDNRGPAFIKPNGTPMVLKSEVFFWLEKQTEQVRNLMAEEAAK